MRRFLLFLMPLAIASCSQGPMTNIALNRTAIASSNYDFYLNAPGGLCGNDDCGQMSAWYIFSALGYYPVNPVGGEFVPGEAQVRCHTNLSLDYDYTAKGLRGSSNRHK